MHEKFEYKGVNNKQILLIGELREDASLLLERIEKNCPDSREKSLAITKLEECIMWANKSISHND